MAVIEITCPHCSARTYVTFVRQTGNGSCPECGNEIINVFQYSQASSPEGTLLTDNFSSSAATIISGVTTGGDGQDLFGDNIPVEPLPEVAGPALATESAPMLVPSTSGPTLVPLESAPMLVPSNSAPTLIPNDSSPPGKVEGMLLTPPPPRLRQFAAEEPAAAKAAPELDEINLEEVAPAAPADDSETKPRLPSIAFAPVGAPAPRPPTGRVNKASGPVKRPTGNVAASPMAPIKPPTGRVQKPPTAPIAKPPTRRPTAAVAPAAAPAPTRRPTSPIPVRRPTAPIPAQAAPLAPGDEPSLLTPPLPPSGTRAVMPPAGRKPTSSLPKPGTRALPPAAADSGGRIYAPIRVPAGPVTPPSTARPPMPPAPPKRPTAKLSVVALGEAPRLAPPERPKDFAKPKFDPNLTRLGYTMPGSDVSHFDGLPEPSPVPLGASLDHDGAQAAPKPPPPGPRPGTRAAMPKPVPPPKEEYADLDEFAAGLDAPAAAVSKADISEDWAPAGPNSGIVEKIDIPGDLDDVASDSAATTVPEDQPADEDEEIGADFEAEAETRQLPTQEKPKPTPKAKPRPADDGPRPVYHARSSIDWEVVRYRAFVGFVYTICALALIAFFAGLYHVHVRPLF